MRIHDDFATPCFRRDHRGFDWRIERGTRTDEEGVVSGHPVRYRSYGTVDIDEAKKAASDLFDRLDTDRDGSISIKELQSRLSGKDFSAADPDKDKTLTKDEYLTVVKQRFKAADTDGDGTVNAEEFRKPAGQALARLLHP